MKSEGKKYKIVILWHNWWRLANQLWNYISLYAYALEKWYDIINPSFFEHEDNFPNIPKNNSIIFKILKKIKNRKIKIWIYYVYIKLFELFNRKNINYSNNNFIENNGENYISKWNNIFTYWWEFRNEYLINKYRNEIRHFFYFNDSTKSKVEEFLKKINNYNKIIWVHIRRGDYRTFQWWKLYIDDKTAVKYLTKINKELWWKNKFIICSDENIDLNKYKELDVTLWIWWVYEDLYLLSKCDQIIWSRSTFGLLAAYLWKQNILYFK